jgi:ubiquinol-cytochrome c reductase iron-sulfur subunit
LYEEQSHELICPCHQSTFDVLDGARPVFGPATRSLPQLAISVNPDGFLVADGDFTEPVGPGFWNRK